MGRVAGRLSRLAIACMAGVLLLLAVALPGPGEATPSSHPLSDSAAAPTAAVTDLRTAASRPAQIVSTLSGVERREGVRETESAGAAKCMPKRRHPLMDCMDDMRLGVSEPAPDRPVSQIEWASVAVATLKSGYTHRATDTAVGRWMRHAIHSAKRRALDPTLAWARGPSGDESTWIADLIAVLALVESYGMSEDVQLAPAVAHAVHALSQAQNRHGAFGPGGGSFACTFWAAKVFESMEALTRIWRRCEIEALSSLLAQPHGERLADPASHRAALRDAWGWFAGFVNEEGFVRLDRVDRSWFALGQPMEVGFEDRVGPTAAACLVGVWADEDPLKSPRLRRAATWISQRLPPDWRVAKALDPVGAWTTLEFLYQGGGKPWKRCRICLNDAHGLELPRESPGTAGRPTSRPSMPQLAFSEACLTVYFRYERVFGRPKSR